MKQFIAGALLSFASFFVFQDLAGAEGADIPDREIRHKNKSHLFFVFSPDRLEHQIHARRLQALAKHHEQELEITGIVHSKRGETVDAVGLEDFRIQNGLSYKLLSIPVASLDPQVPTVVKEKLGGVTDFVLLVDNSGKSIITGDGDDLVLIDSAIGAGSGSVRTEVEENTWGKIKLLFN